MTLEELISELEVRDPEKKVLDGFGEGMSWRGSFPKMNMRSTIISSKGKKAI